MTLPAIETRRGIDLAPTSAPPGLWHALGCILALIAAIVLEGRTSDAWMLVALAGAAAAIVLHAVTRYRTNGRFIAEPTLILVAVFFVWHFSFWVVYALGLASSYRIRSYFAIEPSLNLSALFVCLGGLLALIAGVECGLNRRRWRHHALPSKATILRAFAAVGALFVASYAFLGGTDLHGRYAAVFLEEDPIRRIYNLGVTLVLATIGPLVVLGRSRRRDTLIAVAAIVPTVFVSTYIGSRWILFTAVLVYFAARSTAGQRTRLVSILAIGLVLVPIGIVVKEVRAGRAEAMTNVRQVIIDRHTNPLVEFPEEIGQTFIPVVATMAIRENGEALLLGRSFLDAALSVFPSLPRLLGLEVERPVHEIARTFYFERYVTEGYTVGYSIVAELLRNFGLPGVVIGLAALGFAVGRVYARYLVTGSFTSLCISFALLAILVFGMRNDVFTWFRNAVWACGILLVLTRALGDGRRLARSSP